LKGRAKGPIKVFVHGGTYYQDEPLVFGPEDSGTAEAPVIFAAFPGERITLSGGRKLDCRWKPYQDGIMMCQLPAVKEGRLLFTQLFVNGRRQIPARFPNYDPENPLVHGRGYLNAASKVGDEVQAPHPDANDDMTFSGGAPRGIIFDAQTFTKKNWPKRHEAVIHIFQAYYWGNLQWQIKDIDRTNQIIWFGRGGWQMGAKWSRNPGEVSKESRFYIENVLEELDVPGEWYLDRETGILYCIPPRGVDLKMALVEAPVLQQLVRFVGTQDEPVQHITIDGFRISHTASTFLEKYEIPSLSDWAIHRGGSVLLEGARNCTVKNCWFDAVGGNGVFMSDYNRSNVVSGCKFTETGDSAICFVGSLESTNGTQRDFPYECQATNNLIHDCGVFGKQIAGVYISRAKRITVSHNLIYNMPRAGICIGDGTWGGHVIEFNHLHDTVRETGDHGPFNAWGRDKYWSLVQSHLPYTKHRSLEAGKVEVDAMEPVTMRNNFFEEKPESIQGIHGPVFGIDLDDGASNYEIYNNITKGVSVKLREGAKRTIYNNIWVDSVVAPCFHVGNEYNHDRYFHNITVMSRDDVYSIIAPPTRGPWLEDVDYNCFFSRSGKFTARVEELRGEEGPDRTVQRYGLEEWRQLGFDLHSVFADPLFVDPAQNDFRVQPDSPARKLGFKNFEMGRWGLTKDFPEIWRE
jgi:hypothetical protein